MTNKTAFTRRGGPPWPPVSNMSIRGCVSQGQARRPVPTGSFPVGSMHRITKSGLFHVGYPPPIPPRFGVVEKTRCGRNCCDREESDFPAWNFARHSGESRNPFYDFCFRFRIWLRFAGGSATPESGTDEADIYGGVRIFLGRERERPGEKPKTKAKMDSGFRRNDGCCGLSGRMSQGRFVKRPFLRQGPFANGPYGKPIPCFCGLFQQALFRGV